MHLIRISAVIVGENRQRQEFDPEALGELQASIETTGLMHPIVVREVGENFHLVAGERRLRVIKLLAELDQQIRCNNQAVPLGYIPALTLGELEPLAAMEAELEENIRRRDLTWQEQAEAMQKLAELRQMQRNIREEHPEKVTPADIAQEVHGRADGWYQDNVKQQLMVARHLDDPDVARAKNLTEATKILKQKSAAAQNERLAAVVGKTFSASDHKVLHGDCLKWMYDLEPASYDVVITDPPYGMGADAFGDGGGKLTGISHEYNDSPEAMRQLLAEALGAINTVCKPQAHLYIFCDIDQFHWLRDLVGASSDWHVFRTPLVLVKPNSGRVPLPEHGPRRQYELILYAFRGKKPVTKIVSDVLTVPGDPNLGHGAQKPVGVYTDLLSRSVQPGDRVLDPFAGTGPVLPAAHSLRCYATAIEKEAQYYGECVKRLEALK